MGETKEQDLLYLQHLLRDIERLHERLRTGQRLLKEAIKDQSIVQATKLIDHFVLLNEQVVQSTEELILTYQYVSLGIKGHVLRNGRYVGIEELKNETDVLELDAKLLLVLDKMQKVFGEIPHDLLYIED